MKGLQNETTSLRLKRTSTMEPNTRKRQIMIWYMIAALIGVFLIQLLWTSYSKVEVIPYTQFEKLLSADQIATVTVSQDSIQGTLKEPLPDGKKSFFTTRVDPQLANKLAAHEVVVTGTQSSGIVQDILSWVIPLGIFYLIWLFFFRRVAERQDLGGLMAIGKSHAKVYVETDTKVSNFQRCRRCR
jgi:cell division protease FtsH